MARIPRCLSCSLPGCYGLACIDAEEEAMRRAGFSPDSAADLRDTNARAGHTEVALELERGISRPAA